MKLKTKLNSKENIKNSDGRLSLKVPLTSRRKLESCRLSIPNGRESLGRTSFTTLQTRQSFPANPTQYHTVKKERIIQNLMRKLDDEQELRSIISYKYFNGESASQMSISSQTLQTNTSLTHNSDIRSCKPFMVKYDWNQPRYLHEKLRDCQNQMAYFKQTARDISQSIPFLYQEMNYLQGNIMHKKNFKSQINRKSISNQVGVQTNPAEDNGHYVLEQYPQSRGTFIENIDSTLDILNGASMGRFR